MPRTALTTHTIKRQQHVGWGIDRDHSTLTWWFCSRIFIWLWNFCNWSLYSWGTVSGIPDMSAIAGDRDIWILFTITSCTSNNHRSSRSDTGTELLHTSILWYGLRAPCAVSTVRCAASVCCDHWVCNIYFLHSSIEPCYAAIGAPAKMFS